MENFDLRKFLKENRETLNETQTSFKELEGGKVDFTVIVDGKVQIFFDNNKILEFDNNKTAKIRPRR